MRLVVDTNVLISALLWRGPPHDLLVMARSGAVNLITSPILLAELSEVLDRPKFSAVLVRVKISPHRFWPNSGNLRRS